MGCTIFWVKCIDIFMAHAAVMIAAVRAPNWILEVFPLAVMFLWLAEEYASSEEAADRLHAILHVVTVVGMHLFIWNM